MNISAILVAAVAAFVIGFLLHGPILGKLWMKLANIHPTGKEKFSDMSGQMVLNMIVNIVMASVLSGLFVLVFSSPFMGDSTALRGAICAAWVWLGFIAAPSSLEVIWMKKSYKLWLYDSFSALLSIAAMGAIIAAW